jgi:hypothetical protein
MKKRLWSLALVFTLAGCGAPGRPTGLPAPEYEEPKVEPWLAPEAAKGGAAGSAAVGAGVEPAPEAPAGLPQNAGGSGATLPAGTP